MDREIVGRMGAVCRCRCRPVRCRRWCSRPFRRAIFPQWQPAASQSGGAAACAGAACRFAARAWQRAERPNHAWRYRRASAERSFAFAVAAAAVSARTRPKFRWSACGGALPRRWSSATTQIPHFSYIEEIDITELEALREHLNANRTDGQPKLTYLPFIMLSVARALGRFPQLNAHYDVKREVITRFEAVHLGVATQTDRGLCVPVVRHAEAMDLWQAAREMRRITEAARNHSISRDELTDSTFTITSLGRDGGIGGDADYQSSRGRDPRHQQGGRPAGGSQRPDRDPPDSASFRDRSITAWWTAPTGRRSFSA